MTIKDFNYNPTQKTKEIWKYLNATNLIKLEDYSDKKNKEDLEKAANQGQVDDMVIFNIYKQIPFNLSTLINAKNVYQTLEETEARSLIFQKYLLSEDVSTRVEYLFYLRIYLKNNLGNIFTKKLSDTLKNWSENIPRRI